MSNLDTEGELGLALARSRDPHAGVRLEAVVELARYMHDSRTMQRLIDMLDDEIVNVEVDAAEVLARHGGKAGLLTILENLGRRGDDGDSDYIANRLNALDASGAVPVFDLMLSVDEDELSENQKLGIRDLRELRGEWP